jgi:hypothetical protein
MRQLNKRPMKPALAPATAGVTAMINLMEELSHIMGQETELVNGRKQKEHAVLLKRKQRLTIDYRAGMKSIAAQPELINSLPDDLRVALKASAQKLAEITDRNAKMLRTAVMATQRLIQNIVSIVKKEALTKPGYTDPRTAHMALGVYSPVCKPVAVSQTA